MENKSKVNIFVIILVIIIVALVVYILLLQNKLNNIKVTEIENPISDQEMMINEEEKNVVQKEETTQRELTTKELKDFEEFLSMNPWITTFYTNIEDANLSQIMYCLANSSDEIRKEYEELFMKDEGDVLTVEAFKITPNEVKDLVKKNTGKTISNLDTMKEEFIYIAEKDAYYLARGDTNLFGVKCNSGYQTSDGKYVINYEDLYSSINDKKGIVTLEKKDGNYLFLSNEEK